MPHVLAVLEQRDGAVRRVSQETLAAARFLADDLECDVHGLLIGPPNTSNVPKPSASTAWVNMGPTRC